MKRFGYLRDPLFLACLVLYCGNRFLIKRCLPNTFSISYLNDLICIPFWVPIMLWSMRKAGLRAADTAPAACEILIPLVVWCLFFESIAPYMDSLRGFATADPADILCYSLGALGAGVFWRRWYGAAMDGKAGVADPAAAERRNFQTHLP